MSRNLAERQYERTFTNTLKSLSQKQTKSRILEPQGSESLELVSLFGYYWLAIPDGSIATNSAYITLTSNNHDLLSIASLVHSAYVEYPASQDEVVNADLDDHGLDDDTWQGWLTFDSRPDFGAGMQVPYQPAATLEQRLMNQMAATGIEPYQTNIGFKYARMSNAARPAEVGTVILFLYEVRLLIG